MNTAEDTLTETPFWFVFVDTISGEEVGPITFYAWDRVWATAKAYGLGAI